MADDESLRRREAERNDLRERSSTALHADERVAAAWLAGSLGRGVADPWSDLDLWVVVDDAIAATSEIGRHNVVSSVGIPLLTLGAPPNAPAGGAYLLAPYPGQTGPHQVDWYWQPRTSARLPPGVDVLCDRIGLPPLPDPALPVAEERARLVSEKVAAFWVAVLVAGKGIARRRPWDVVAPLGWAAASLADARVLIERGTLADDAKPGGAGRTPPPPGDRPEDQLAALRALCREMDALNLAVAALGGSVPAEAARQVVRFLDLVGSTVDGADR